MDSCTTCSGTGKITHTACNGTGKVKCSTCNGTGSTTTSVNCEHSYWDSHYYCTIITGNHGKGVNEYH